MSKKKLYLVYFKSHKIEKFNTWNKCKNVVLGNSDVLAYKGFTNEKDAENWLNAKKALYEPLNSKDKLLLYSDGGCRTYDHSFRKKGSKVSDKDLSAWAYVLVKNDTIIDSNSGFNYGRTNNYQELNGCYHGMEAIKRLGYDNEDIILVTDSKYLISVLNFDWYQKDSSNKPNRLAGMELFRLYNTFKNISISWTKGHADNRYNNLCDELCTVQIENHYQN